MRLRTSLVGILLLVAVVLSGMIYLGFAMHKQDIVSQERTEVETAASVVSANIHSYLTGRGDVVELWARNSEIARHGTAVQDAALSQFVEQTRFDGGAVVATNGTIVAFRERDASRTFERTLIGADTGSRADIQQALEGSTYVSNPFQSTSERRILAVSTPIRRNGSVVGVFTGSLHFSDEALFVGATTVGQSDQQIVVSVANETVFRQGGSVAGTPISSSATVEEFGWQVTVSQDRNAITPHLQRATLLQFGSVLLALVALALAGYWVSRTTLVQINALDDGLAALERGAYDTDLALDATDEWRSISGRYNALSDTLQQRQSQLQVLNRVLRHNLRNDMNVVTAHAESVLARDETSDDVAEDVEKIIATASRLIDTSEHARAFYEDLLSGDERQPEPVDVVEIVEARLETLRAEFPDCSFRTDFSEPARALDTTTLPIIVEEVIHNAVVHNDRPEDKREIAVAVESRPDSSVSPHGEVAIHVVDNGPGIPMVEEALLTDELEETPVDHGSGLGVWLVNWLVRQLGGTVQVTSGIDRGTTVTIRVPAAPPE